MSKAIISIEINIDLDQIEAPDGMTKMEAAKTLIMDNVTREVEKIPASVKYKGAERVWVFSNQRREDQ